MKMRNQKDYYKCVGIKDGQLYMVDYTFEDTMHGKPFVGVTGSVFCPVYQDDIDQRNDLETVIENYGYLWTEAVKAGQTTDSQEDYIQSMIDAEVNYGDGMFFGHDTSYIHKIPDEIREKYFPDAVTFECVSGGRCFYGDEEFDVLIDPALLLEIQRLEKPKRKQRLKAVKGASNG